MTKWYNVVSFIHILGLLRNLLFCVIFQLYISDENTLRTEYTFKTALDILIYVEDNEERCALK